MHRIADKFRNQRMSGLDLSRRVSGTELLCEVKTARLRTVVVTTGLRAGPAPLTLCR
jgi:hypothetical protein